MKLVFKKLVLIPLVLVLAVLVYVGVRGGASSSSGEVLTGTVRFGDLTITVVENGNVRAKNNLSIRSDVSLDSGLKILSIIPEGYFVTAEDVSNKKILLELDPTLIEEKLIELKSVLRESEAGLTEAAENYAIRGSQNESTLKAARQEARFALLDFKKHLGKKTSEKILAKLDMPLDDISFVAFEKMIGEENLLTERELAPFTARTGQEPPSDGSGTEPLVMKGERDSELLNGVAHPTLRAVEESVVTDIASVGGLPSEPASQVDFLAYIKGNEQTEVGDAAQTYRDLRDDLLVSQNELAMATENFDGSQRLFDKGFITKTSLEQERLSLEKTRLNVMSSETALVLFRDYELPKMAEKYLSDYEESLRKMERAVKENRAMLAQVGARWITARQQHQIIVGQYKQTEEELMSCIVKATVPGLVTYGESKSNRYTDNNEPIAEGANVSYRQTILTIPDMSSMVVDVNVPEARINLVKRELPAMVQADVEPDKTLRATVSEVAVLPDSANTRWTSTKVYPVVLDIVGTHSWLKPGMSAKVEILSKQLKQVLYAPIQAVNRDGDDFVCFVPKLGGWEKSVVKIGSSNDQFIEITEGLGEGAVVALSVPTGEVLRPAKREAEFEGMMLQEEAQDRLNSSGGVSTRGDDGKVRRRSAPREGGGGVPARRPEAAGAGGGGGGGIR